MTQKATPALELRNIVRSFGKSRAADHVSLSVSHGEIICLVGSSGCGKSTLLRIIAGVDHANSGTISVNGREIAGPSVFVEPEDRKIGFVFQDYALFPHLTVERNIMFGLKGTPKAEARRIADELLDHVGLRSHAKRYPHTLSGGEQQRVALARALAPRPAILLMDEPFSNLDRGLRDSVRDDTLALLRKFGTTAIMVTHDPEEALSAGDRVVLMQSGRIVQSGTGYDLHDRPVCRYAADFFCAFNKVPGVVRNNRIETAMGAFDCTTPLADGTPAEAFIRPGAITLTDDVQAIRGSICARMFMGETEQLSISVAGIATPLRVRSMTRTGPDVTDVRLTVRPEGVLVFAQD